MKQFPCFPRNNILLVAAFCLIFSFPNATYGQNEQTIKQKIEIMDSYFQNQIVLYGEETLLEAECSEYNQYLIWKKDILSKVGPTGKEGDYYMSLKNTFDNMLPVYEGSGSWFELGPKQPIIPVPLSQNASSKLGIGPLNFISFDPNYATTGLVFAGGWYSGLWYTEDNGNTWMNGGTDLISPKVSAAHCVSSHLDSDVWFMCTGNGDGLFNDGPFQSARSYGIYRTIDHGGTWELVCTEEQISYSTPFYAHDIYFKPFQIKKLLIDPTSGAENLIVYATTNFGIYRCQNSMEDPSTMNWELVFGWDGNSDFSQVNGSVTNTLFSIYDIEWVPEVGENPCDNCNKLVATISKLANTNSTELPPLPVGNSYSAEWIYSSSIIVSETTLDAAVGDAGSWVELTLPTSLSSMQRISTAMSPDDPNKMFVWGMKLDGTNQLASFSWNTSTWEQNLESFQNWPSAPHAHIYCADGLCIAPNDADILYAPDGDGPGIAKYNYQTDAKTIIDNSTNYHDDVEHIIFSPTGDELWLATHGGVYVLDIANNTWEERNNGLGISEVDGMSQLYNDKAKILIGLFHDGTVLMQNYQTNAESEWNQVAGGDGRFTLTSQDNALISYSSTQSSTMKKNSDSWTSDDTDPLISGISSSPAPDLNYFNNNIIYLERNNIHRHDNKGTGILSEWTQISDFEDGPDVERVFASFTYADILFATINFDNATPNDDTDDFFKIALTNNANSTNQTEAQSAWVILPYPSTFEPQGAAAGDIQSDPFDPNIFYVVSDYYNPPWMNSAPINKFLVYRFIGEGPNYDLTTFDFASYTGDVADLFEIFDLTKNLPNVSIKTMYLNRGTRDIFLGATLGVYYTNSSLLFSNNDEPWYLYGDNLPHCDIKFLEPSYPTNRIRAGAHGRGIWEIAMPCDKMSLPLYSSEDLPLTMDRWYRLRQDIIVEQGTSLTITGQVYFAPKCGIIVKPGGHLIIDGGHLTNACPGELWQGIVLEGNPTLTQYPESQQGFCQMLNGAIIENAHTGVHVAGILPDGTGNCITDESKTGGILKATDATFKNCYVGAEFFPYVKFTNNGNPRTNRSFFNRCQFITDQVLYDSPIVQQPEPKAGIIFNEIYRISVRGCQFKNEAIGNPEFTSYYNSQYKRGDGIQANSAVFRAYNSTSTDGLNTPIACQFENLEHGIKALCGDYIKPFSCKNAVFTNNFCGIRSEGSLLGPDIRFNTFYVNPIIDNMDGEEVSGIEMDNTTKFNISENSFIGSDQLNAQTTIGLAFNNTVLDCEGDNYAPPQAHNMVYHNNMDMLDIGINVQGVNALANNQNSSENYGLEFRCNKFGQNGTPCFTDFNLFAAATVQTIQGAIEINEEAANIFDNDVCDNATEHFTVGAGATIIDKYYHNPNTSSLTLEPNCYSNGSLVPWNTESQFVELSACPSTPIGGINVGNVSAGLTVKMASYQDTHNIYYSKIDRGDFNLLASLVNNPIAESIDIRNELIQCSPYVSDEIWRKTIYRNPAMNPWHLAQALLQNSPLKRTVMQMVMDSDLSPYYKTLVSNGQNGGITTRDIYESDLVLLNRQIQEGRRDIVNHYLLEEEDDDVDRIGLASAVLDDEKANDRLILASLAAWQGDYLSMSQVLNGCPAINGQTDVRCQLLNTIAQDRQDGNPALTQATINTLQAMSQQETDCGYSQARAWLHEYNDEEYPQNIETVSPSYRNTQIKLDGLIELPILAAQPNPSKGIVYVTYQMPEGIEACEMEIIDSNGQLIEKRSISTKGLEEWNCKQCPSGIYLIRLIAEGIEIGVTKVSIVK